MTLQRLVSIFLLSLILAFLEASPAQSQENAVRSFQALAERITTLFQTEADGVRRIRLDVRRRDTLPEADIAMLGVLRFDLKPKDAPGWHSVRFQFGYREGRWRFLKAFHELPSDPPTWTEGGPWYEAVVERALSKPR